MFNDPNSPSSIMNPYAYMITAVDVAARADARANGQETGEDKPAKHKLPNGTTLFDWLRNFAGLAVLPPRKQIT